MRNPPSKKTEAVSLKKVFKSEQSQEEIKGEYQIDDSYLRYGGVKW
jgi:hypothetical protein